MWRLVVSAAALLLVAVGSVQAQISPNGLITRMMEDPVESNFIHSFIANQKHGFPFPNGHECEEDAHKLCSGVLRRCVGSFGCTTSCLSEHAPKLSEGCRKAHPCVPDIDRLCANTPPGQVRSCLHKHLSSLSKECVEHHHCLEEDGDGGKDGKPKIKANSECEVMDDSKESRKPPAFIGNLGAFLNTLRKARANPIANLFRLAQKRGAMQRKAFELHHGVGGRVFGGRPGAAGMPGRNRFVGGHRHMGAAGAAGGGAADIQRQRQQLMRDRAAVAQDKRQAQMERNEIKQERQELLQERRELQQERRAFTQQELGVNVRGNRHGFAHHNSKFGAKLDMNSATPASGSGAARFAGMLSVAAAAVVLVAAARWH